MPKVATIVQAKKVVPHDEKVATIIISDKATKRIIAPFVRIIRKGQKRTQAEESKRFSFYLQKKPNAVIRDLSSFLSDSVDLPSLLHETSEVLKKITKSAGVTLYMMDATSNEIYKSRKTPIKEREKIKWKIKECTTVATYVALKKEYVMVDDIIQDDRFPEGIGYEGESIKSVLCVPIVTPDGECFAVIELYRQLFDEPFTLDDLKITMVVTGWMGAAIHQNSQRLALKRQQELNDYLLDLTKCYFGDTVSVEKMMLELVKFCKDALASERAIFFIIDTDSDELIADMYEEGWEEKDHSQYKKVSKVRFGKDRGIAAIVARTGVTINVKDAYNDNRFNREIDQKTGFITRSILCMPIVGVNGILGVVQVVNKKNGSGFNVSDEMLLRTFTEYCALTLRFTKTRKTVNSSVHLNNGFVKMFGLLQKPCSHELQSFMDNMQINIPPDFDQFNWYWNVEDQSKMPQFILHMFLQLIDGIELNTQNTIQYILSVRKIYGKNPYHNFEHAFNVCHCIHLMIKRNRYRFHHIEIKGLLIAALNHDIDHSGYTNSFLRQTKNTLAQLYQSSISENHHFNLAMLLLKNAQIFKCLSAENYKQLTAEIKEAILATDLSNFFIIKEHLEPLCENNEFDWNNVTHRSYLKAIMMLGSDLSGQCKSFLVAKRITDRIYAEFYKQGDLEKKMGLCPLSILDRTKKDVVPHDQIQFLSIVLLPCLGLLKNLLPNTEDLYKDANLLRYAWLEIIAVRGKKCWRQDDSIVKKSD